MNNKKMWKVLCPIEKNGSTYWMRLGSGFGNKDDSINIYLDAVPVGQKEVKLQLREFTEDELRERAEKRAAYGAATRPANLEIVTPAAARTNQALPF